MNLLFEQMCKHFDDMENVTGACFIWKATAAMLVQPSIPERHRIHVCPFCVAVKKLGAEHEARCMRNDTELVSRKALALRSPFVHRCHAGCHELIIPVFQGDQYHGAVFCGPFNLDRDIPVYVETVEEYCSLPDLPLERRGAIIRLIMLIMSAVAAELRLDDSVHSPGLERVYDPRIRTVITTIHDNFRRRLAVPVLARQCALSPSRFLHLFKEQTGLKFSEYLLRLRTDEAGRLLTSTGLHMNEIAEACGFYDQSHFSAVFNRYKGMTPTVYRKKCQRLHTT